MVILLGLIVALARVIHKDDQLHHQLTWWRSAAGWGRCAFELGFTFTGWQNASWLATMRRSRKIQDAGLRSAEIGEAIEQTAPARSGMQMRSGVQRRFACGRIL